MVGLLQLQGPRVQLLVLALQRGYPVTQLLVLVAQLALLLLEFVLHLPQG